MIPIPPDVQILTTIKKGTVYYFTEETFSSEEPHYFVVLNEKPKTDDFIVLVCGSSKVDKTKAIINKLRLPKETLVEISPSDFSLLSKNTIFDCNSVIEKNKESIIEKLAQGKLGVCLENMPDNIVESLVKSVLLSPKVSGNNKTLIRKA